MSLYAISSSHSIKIIFSVVIGKVRVYLNFYSLVMLSEITVVKKTSQI